MEISLYPLCDEYKTIILDFVGSLREQKGISLTTDGMRTLVSGDYDRVMSFIQHEMKGVLEKHKAVFIIKMAGGDRSGKNYDR